MNWFDKELAMYREIPRIGVAFQKPLCHRKLLKQLDNSRLSLSIARRL